MKKIIVTPFCIDKILLGSKTAILHNEKINCGLEIELQFTPLNSENAISFAKAKVVACIGLTFIPADKKIYRQGPFSMIKCHKSIVNNIIKCNGNYSTDEFWQGKTKPFTTNKIYFENLKEVA